jgi:parallel beta-helix repeat protein
MKNKLMVRFTIIGIIILFIITNYTAMSSILSEHNTLIEIVYVDDDFNESTPGWGYDHFNRIGAGIHAVASNGTVYVYTGNYNERPSIQKSLRLIGENKNTTIIDGREQGSIIKIRADGVTVTGFTIRNSGKREWFRFGIEISSQDPKRMQNNTIYDNIIVDHSSGICSWWGSGNTIIGNTVKSCKYNGIYLAEGSKNTISCNHLEDNQYGICFFTKDTKKNTISRNTFIDNYCAIDMFYSTKNKILQNNFINSEPTFTYPTILYFNKWNGNYWNRPTLDPKPILGKIEKAQLSYLSFRWYNIDWNPASEPNDTSVARGDVV